MLVLMDKTRVIKSSTNYSASKRQKTVDPTVLQIVCNCFPESICQSMINISLGAFQQALMQQKSPRRTDHIQSNILGKCLTHGRACTSVHSLPMSSTLSLTHSHKTTCMKEHTYACIHTHTHTHTHTHRLFKDQNLPWCSKSSTNRLKFS